MRRSQLPRHHRFTATFGALPAPGGGRPRLVGGSAALRAAERLKRRCSAVS